MDSEANINKLLVMAVAQSSFDFWQEDEFRKLVNFDHISQTEQDRIFNELEVTALGLLDLHLTDLIGETVNDNNKNYFTQIKKNLKQSFVETMADLGVEKKLLKTWEMLINMRLKEYREDFKIALGQSENWKEFKEEEGLKSTWARIETQAIDGWTHIRRGNTEDNDPLWKMIRKWLIMLDLIFGKLIQPNLQKVAVS